MKGNGAGPAFEEVLIQVAKVMGPLLCFKEVPATGDASGVQETEGAAGGVGCAVLWEVTTLRRWFHFQDAIRESICHLLSKRIFSPPHDRAQMGHKVYLKQLLWDPSRRKLALRPTKV